MYMIRIVCKFVSAVGVGIGVRAYLCDCVCMCLKRMMICFYSTGKFIVEIQTQIFYLLAPTLAALVPVQSTLV